MASGVRSVGMVTARVSPPPASGTPTAEQKRAALEEVLQSSVFRRADQLRKFLNFICEMEIAGRGEELCEYLIGVEALGRPSDYSPAEDAAVRRRAADLREKLQETYSEELLAAKVRIDLPKGTYVPRFVTSESSILRVARTPLVSTISLNPPMPRYSNLGLIVAFMLGILLTGLAVIGVPSLRSLFSRSDSTQPQPGVIYEAEASGNSLGGEVKAKGCGGCSGGRKVGFIGNGAANFVAINDLNVKVAGSYQLEVDYLLRGNRSFFISVNDGPGMELPLSGNTWLYPATAATTVTLKAGHNRIVFYNESGFAPDLDRVVLR